MTPQRSRLTPRRSCLLALAGLLLAGSIGGTWMAPARAAAPPKPSVEGTVQHVVDGDTLWLAPAGGGAPVEIRLQGIDAPEICQAWGAEAKHALAELVERQAVRVELDGVDTYGRRLGTVYVDTRNINRTMVQEGHAWSARYKWDRGPYVADERMAKALSRGFNHEAGAQMPKDFRRDHGPCTGTESAAPAPATATVASKAAAPAAAPLPATVAAVAYRCDGRTRCSQMTSCAEATWFLRHCPGVQMDGNHDGVPCERQWCRP